MSCKLATATTQKPKRTKTKKIHLNNQIRLQIKRKKKQSEIVVPNRQTQANRTLLHIFSIKIMGR
ncbi:MAG: hypothetical protein MHMPM18_002991 [Marteilia pararefringens]